MKSREFKPSTEHDYRDVIKRHVMPYAIGMTQLVKLHPMHVVAWHAELRDKGVGARTQQRAHAVLRSALKTAVVLRAIDVSPAESVPSPRYKAKERPTLDHDQTKKLLDVRERHRWEAFNKLARLHGMRLGEIAALRWKDVDLKSRVV